MVLFGSSSTEGWKYSRRLERYLPTVGPRVLNRGISGDGIGTNRYGNGAGHEGFELEVELELEGDELTYVWSWGPPHEAVVERTRAVLRRSAS